MIKFINREQLYKQVWSEPFTKLAPKYKVSATDLRKLCNKFLIPIPKMGHWQKIAFGHILDTPTLPNYKYFTLVIKKVKNIKTKVVVKPTLKEEKKIEATLPIIKNKITVKQSLTSPHPIIARTRDKLQAQKADEYGRVCATGDGTANIRVSKKHYKRALRIFDAIFKWFEKKGYIIDTIGYHGLHIKIGEDNVYLEIEEKSTSTGRMVHNGWYNIREFIPTDKIALVITNYMWNRKIRRRFSDGKTQTVEELLPNFIDAVFNVAAIEKGDRLRKEQEEKERKNTRIQNKYTKQCEELENSMIKNLEQQANDLDFSMKLQSYISAVEDKVKSQYENIPIETMQWLDWANKYLEKINPLTDSLPTYTKAEEQLSIEDVE